MTGFLFNLFALPTSPAHSDPSSFSQPAHSVRRGQWVGAVWLKLLQTESGITEELGLCEDRLREGGRGSGVRHLVRGGAVCDRPP